MRRGLMAWNEAEVPPAALAGRLARLRAAMAAHGLDALVLYTNFPRPSAVTFVTAFTPYWADALLLVPKEGEPVFATALSKRVAKWIQSVKPVGELVNTPRPGQIVGERIAADPAIRKVGILEMDALPGGLYDDLVEKAPDAAFVEGGPAFAQGRFMIDSAERGLLARANALAETALAAVDHAAMRDAGTAVGAVEKAARLVGAEEAYVHIAPDLAADARFARLSGAVPLGGRFALRASVAYKGIWVRRVRTYPPVPVPDVWFADTLAALKPGRHIGQQLAAAVRGLKDAMLTDFIAESSIGSYPLETVASSNLDGGTPDNSLLVVTLRLMHDGVPWLAGAPVIVSAAGNDMLRGAS